MKTTIKALTNKNNVIIVDYNVKTTRQNTANKF